MTAACESDFRPSPSPQWRVDCKQKNLIEVSAHASKRQFMGTHYNNGSHKEGMIIGKNIECGRRDIADDKLSVGKKQQNCAAAAAAADDDDACGAMLHGGLKPKSRDGAKNPTEHFHRELPGSRLPWRRKVSFRPDPHVEYIVLDDDSEDGDPPPAAAICPSKPTKQPQLQLHPPGMMNVGLESFLPQGHVKVLLVEDDDSTRHVVSALLRNCKYEVIAAANVVEAWELLENPNHRFDLVLLDVIVPSSSLSGVSLLLKIMEHHSFKQIPVVMTSKHDSMDIVYQCLSKGAADFLVKPMRKNELKNLWKHVWRKNCNRSANTGGVGRSTVNETRKLVAPCSPVDSNNMSGSHNVKDCENAADGLNILGGSDNGSGNQPLQVQRNHGTGPSLAGDGDEDYLAISEDKSSSDQRLGCDLEMATPRSTHHPDDIDSTQQETDGQQQMDLDDPTSVMQGKRATTMVEKCNHWQQEGEPSTSGTDNGSAEMRCQKAVDLIGAIKHCQPPPTTSIEQPGESTDAKKKSMDQRGINSPKEKKKLGDSCFDSAPTLDLTLKWPRNSGIQNGDSDERQWWGLCQSRSSAFSRYSTVGLQQQEHHPSGGTPSSRGHQSTEGAHGTQGLPRGGLAVNSSRSPPQIGMPPDCTGSSKGSGEVCNPALETHTHNPHNGNGQDTSSSVMAQSSVVQSGLKLTNKEAAAKVQGMSRATPSPSPGSLYTESVPPGYGPTMHPMYYICPGPAWVVTPSPHGTDEGEVFDHPSAENQHVPFGHLHMHPENHHLQGAYYHSHHQHNTWYHEPQHHTLSFQLLPLPQQQEEQQPPTDRAPHCGSSAATVLDRTNGQSGSSSHGYRNGSVNESPSRNKNGSNGHNSHCNEAVAAGANRDSSTGNCGSGCGSRVDNSTNAKNGFDGFDGVMPAYTPEDLMAWRETALNKFQQKRKDRCFAKKVCYHSQKKLAEQ